MIYVYEPDAFIREDIVETLQQTLQVDVSPVAEWGGLTADRLDARDVAVLSLSRTDAALRLKEIFALGPETRVVLIAGDVPQGVTDVIAAYVPKPFSSDTLVRAVKTVLSDLQ